MLCSRFRIWCIWCVFFLSHDDVHILCFLFTKMVSILCYIDYMCMRCCNWRCMTSGMDKRGTPIWHQQQEEMRRWPSITSTAKLSPSTLWYIIINIINLLPVPIHTSLCSKPSTLLAGDSYHHRLFWYCRGGDDYISHVLHLLHHSTINTHSDDVRLNHVYHLYITHSNSQHFFILYFYLYPLISRAEEAVVF